jgi:very-short-patch-repair endonuclease
MKPFSIFDKILTKSERRRLNDVGIKATLHPRTHFTSLERKYYLMLKDLGIYYVPQYPLSGRFYDAYLPDQKILIEFDGTFWHPQSEKDCKYDFQKKNMKVDKLKNQIAERQGLKIVRIREEQPLTTDQFKKLILG